MANKTDGGEHNSMGAGSGQGQQIERAVVAADGTITIHHSGADLQSVDVADVDLLLGFPEGVFVVIPNGALDAISDSLHKVVFLEDDDSVTASNHLSSDHLGTLGDLFKMVGTTNLAKAGSLRVVSENVDAPADQGYGYTPEEDAQLADDNAAPDPDVQVSGGKAAGTGVLVPSEDLLEPVASDPVMPVTPPTPIYKPGHKVANIEPAIHLDPNVTSDDIVNLLESKGDVAIHGTVGGTAIIGDTVTVTVNNSEYTGLVETDMSFSINVTGADLVADLDKQIEASITSGNKTATDFDTYRIDLNPPAQGITLDNVTADNVINLAESGGDVMISGSVDGEIQVGDTITLTVNGVDSIGSVRADSSFSVIIRGSDLVADSDHTIDASVTNINGTATASADYAVDLVPPTATILVDDSSLIAGETSLVTITFNEAVTDFSNADLTLVENGSLSEVSSADGGITWTTYLTPDAPIEDTTNIISLYNSGVTDLAGNLGTGTSVSNNYAIDNIVPTVLDVTLSDQMLSDPDIGPGSFTITVNFSEPMDSTVAPTLTFGTDLSTSIINGSGVWSTSGTSYTATYDVIDANVDLSNINIDVSGAQDASGNLQQGYSAAGSLSIDTLNPTVSITNDNTDGVVSDADNVVNYTLTFSEAVKFITASDLAISGGEMDPGSLLLAADGLTASFAVTATDSSTADLTVTVNDSILDLHDNPLLFTADNTNTLPVDTFTLTAVMTEDNTDGVVSDGDNLVNYTLVFSDKIVAITDLDIHITGGTLFSGPTLEPDGVTATFAITADDSSTADLSVTLGNSIVDLLGHPLITLNNTLTVDTLNPTVSIDSSNIDGVVSDADRLTSYTLNFSEAVASIVDTDLIITGGTLDTGSLSLAADGLSASFTVTVPDNITGNLSVTVKDSILDLNGNPLVVANSTLPIDTTNPIVTNVTVDDLMITDTNTGTLAVNVTFSEPVDRALPPTLVFSPNVDGSLVKFDEGWYVGHNRYLALYRISDANIELTDITIDVTGVQDDYGNVQQDYTAAVEFSIDTLAPTVIIADDSTAGVVSDANNLVNYTLTFSEEVASIVAADLTINGGTMTSGPTLAADGLSANFSLTASDNSIADLSVTVNGSIVDLNGNPLVPASNTLTVDTLNPTVTIGDDNTDGTVSDMDNPVNYTLTFSEEVASITAADLTITGGTLTVEPVLAADGLSATFTVTATNESTTDLSVTLNSSIVDLNGNPLVSANNTLAVNTVDPLTDFVSSLYTSPEFKVTGGSGVPAGSYMAGATAAEHALASSPAGQASIDIINGTAGNDNIIYNPAFHNPASSIDDGKWVKVLHIDFDLLTQLTTIELVADPTISGISGFHFEGTGLVWDGSNTWTLNPDALTSDTLLLNGLDLNVVYDVAGTGGPIDFGVKVNVSGTDGTVVFDQVNNNIISNTLDFSWRDASSAADFDLTQAGNQVMVLPRGGMGVEIHASDGNDTVVAGAGDDLIYGGAGADLLDGGAGSDTASYEGSTASINASLASGSGLGGDAEGDQYLNIENLTGGAGDDTLTGDINANILDGGAGNDTVDYSGSSADISASLLTAMGTSGEAAGDQYFSIENLVGGAGNDILIGDANANILSGGAGDDILIGGVGADILNGGTHSIIGDSVSYASAGSAINASLVTNQGTDGVDIDHFSGIENLIGSSYGDVLTGDGNNNILTGGTGADVLDGGGGIDTASYANATTGVIASLTSSFSPFQTNDAQGDSFNSIENLTGSDYNDSLYGDSNSNTLTGGDGADTLDGLAGNDHLSGGLGNDSIYADTGHDTVDAGFGDDRIFVSSDINNLPNLIDGGDGTDSLVLQGLFDGGSYDLSVLANLTNNIEILDIRDGAGTTISITGLDVQNMVDAGASSQLIIVADNGDSLDLSAFGNLGTDYTATPIAAGTEYTIVTGDQATIHWHIA